MGEWQLWTKRGLSVLFVMATEQEYGPELRARIHPLITGVGPVEAASVTGAVLGELKAKGELPKLVFSLGSAGSRNLEHAEVYQLASVSYRDMDCSPLGFARGRVPFLNEDAVVPMVLQIPGIASASIATGASIVSGAMYDGIGADMVDMESYAVYRAAKHFGVPMIGLRGITDGRTELSKYEDWADYLHIVDHKLAADIDRFSAAVESGAFSL
ncbi:MAG: 5'-methylthioadenosine/S-adenosylhomocysteine nucleosidase [Xanthobacteraceae bacterium]|nr:5'-methylthioadenosine/S-adenosylhomocysteine nucleosidase [Xanthobacteraceae bacterium]MBX3523164.1 5'-methylthioadenosine/S-adenosylhomocysteine nucleosidase [Xanthobacteraceae bacterium]MBX3535948.1 5'-methylthioadenosine/S-adenosylhomocysteine nucleosidase [Xanthobacteraceae bacterium]